MLIEWHKCFAVFQKWMKGQCKANTIKFLKFRIYTRKISETGGKGWTVRFGLSDCTDP